MDGWTFFGVECIILYMSQFSLISDMGIYSLIVLGNHVCHSRVHAMQKWKHLGGGFLVGVVSMCCSLRSVLLPLSTALNSCPQQLDSVAKDTCSRFLPAGAALRGARRSPGTRRAAGGARRRRCSTSWPASCRSPTASPPTWTRPPS